MQCEWYFPHLSCVHIYTEEKHLSRMYNHLRNDQCLWELTTKVMLKMHYWVHLNYVLAQLNEKVRRTSATSLS